MAKSWQEVKAERRRHGLLSITSFLRACIAEDERKARRAIDAPTSYDHFGENATEEVLELAESEGAQFEAIDHLRRHDPTRVLAKCERLLYIVELHSGDHVCWRPDHPIVGEFTESMEYDGLCATTRALAAIWSDHEDWREEWKL